MSKRKPLSELVDVSNVDPAILAHLEILLRQRERASRLLKKRRREKSHQ